MLRSRLAACCALLFAAACGNPVVVPPRAVVSARVTHQAATTYGVLALTIAVTVTNTTREPVHYNFCDSTLERQNAAGVWEGIGGVLCNAVGCINPLHCMVMIRAGESWEWAPQFYPSADILEAPGSNYRLRSSVAVPAEVPAPAKGLVAFPISIQSLTSNEFGLVPTPD